MLLVGGGILTHGIPALHHGVEQVAHASGAAAAVVGLVLQALVGVVAGAVIAGGVHVARMVVPRGAHAPKAE
jgi:predicted DNA repair protein MutK